MKNKETLCIGWCDNGVVQGSFMAGIVNALIEGPKNKINITNAIRIQGNQIAKQRQILWDLWSNDLNSDWLLWIDSDIVINIQTICMLLNAADKETRPVVSGVYFISNQNEKSLMEPVPAIFMETDNTNQISVVNPFPENQLIPIDITGFGLLLMHRSIIDSVNSAAGDLSVFAETNKTKNRFIGEDASFCRNLKKAGIQLYAHTGIMAPHMKTFSFDQNYYNVYWNALQKELFTKGK